MRTLNNTKSNGRWAARNMLANGATVAELALAASVVEARYAVVNRHFLTGFTEEVRKRMPRGHACIDDAPGEN